VPPAAAPQFDTPVAKSQELWRIVHKKDVSAIKRLATEDFFNVDWTGLTSKAELTAAIPDYDNVAFKRGHFKFARIDRSSAVMLHRVVFHATDLGKRPGPSDFNATNVWTPCDGEWRVALDTETAVTGTL